MGKYTMGQDDARYERATCPQCRAELVRHPDLEDNRWKAHRSTPTPEEELGGSGYSSATRLPVTPGRRVRRELVGRATCFRGERRNAHS